MQRNDDAVSAQPELRRLVRRLRAALPELLRFGAVGAASAGIYFALLWLFERLLSWPLGVLGALAYGTGILFNYVVQKSFTFRSLRQHEQAGPRYLVVQGSSLLINSAVLWLGVDLAHWWYPPVQLAGLVLAAAWSYVGQKFWAFHAPRRPG